MRGSEPASPPPPVSDGPAVRADVPATKRVMPAVRVRLVRALLEKAVSPRRIPAKEERMERSMKARVASQKAAQKGGEDRDTIRTGLPAWLVGYTEIHPLRARVLIPSISEEGPRASRAPHAGTGKGKSGKLVRQVLL